MSNRKGCVASWKMRRTGAAEGSAHKMDAAVFGLRSILQRQPKGIPEGLTSRRYLTHGAPINAERASVQTAPERSRIDSRFCRRGDLHGLEERPRGFRVLTVAAGWWSAPSLGWACRDARVKTTCVRPCITRSKTLNGGGNEKSHRSANLRGLTSSSDQPQLRDFLTPTFSARMGKEASSKHEGVCFKGAHANHRSRGRGAPALT